MAFQLISYGWRADGIRSPIERLAMLYLCKHADPTGLVTDFDAVRAAAFACCKPEEVNEAVLALERRGHLHTGSTSVLLTLPTVAWAGAENDAPMPDSLRQQVLDEGECFGCGEGDRLEADHIIPRAHGGLNSADNLQPLCRTCNRRKGARVGYVTL